MRLVDNTIRMPKDLKDIIDDVYMRDQAIYTDSEDFLIQFNRKIDQVFLCVFYGLYKSMELFPSISLEVDIDESSHFNNIDSSHRFSVKIPENAKLLRHQLLSLWLILEGSSIVSSSNYRERLYHFLNQILDDNFMTNVIIPFYLSKASEPEFEGELSFISKLRNSAFVMTTMSIYSPELLIAEFIKKKNAFDKFKKDNIPKDWEE